MPLLCEQWDRYCDPPKAESGRIAPLRQRRSIVPTRRPTGIVNMVAESVLSEAARRLVEGFHPRKVILFGSRARGTGDDRSDFDFLVICDDVHDRRTLTLAMDRSLAGLPIARDILVLTPEEFERDRHIPGTVARPASKEGRVLYDAAA